MRYPSNDNDFLNGHAALLNGCYRNLLGNDLVVESQTQASLAEAMFYAPFVIVSHNSLPDPIFNYANLMALELFEFSWKEFTKLPSRFSAEPMHQLEREKLLEEVSQRGRVSEFQKWVADF
jgi:hypothetical protein